MANILFTNNASALLVATIDSIETVIQVAAGFGANFPLPGGTQYFMIAVEDNNGEIEIMRCTSRAADLLTVVRGQDGSIAKAFTLNVSRVDLRLTKAVMEAFLQLDGGTMTGALDMNGNNIVDAIVSGSFSSAVQILAPADTAGAPAFAYTVDPDTGMFHSSTNTLGLAAAGASVARLNSSGILLDLGAYRMSEIAAAVADVAGVGQVWTMTATPNQLWFTNDAGTDIRLDDAVHDSGNETIAGVKTFSSSPVFTDEIHGQAANSPATPAYSFSTDLDTGMYRSAANTIAWSTGGTLRLTLSSVGALTATGDITAFSDRRFKKGIRPIVGALDKVLQLNGYTFERTDGEAGRRHAGVIAQEVEAVLPEVVHRDADGNRSVAYGNMIGLLIEAIKELAGDSTK